MPDLVSTGTHPPSEGHIQFNTIGPPGACSKVDNASLSHVLMNLSKVTKEFRNELDPPLSNAQRRIT